MPTGSTALSVIAFYSVVVVASGDYVPCSAGTRVYSLNVWSGYWLDGLIMRCTGDGKEQTIPPDFYAELGGGERQGICAGTGGVQSIEWGVPDRVYGMVYLNITCLDNETYHFSNGASYDSWNITSKQTASCKEGEYVQGLVYTTDYPANSSFSYFLTSVGFICSSSTLDPICTGCSGDTRLKSDEDQPDFCELPSCSEMECCESSGSQSNADQTESITMNVMIGVVSTVVAAMIISGSAWSVNKIKRSAIIGGAEGFHEENASSVNIGYGNRGTPRFAAGSRTLGRVALVSPNIAP